MFTYYCSTTCQDKDWPVHKQICRVVDPDLMPAKKLNLHCKLIPPVMYRSGNQEQDFWLSDKDIWPFIDAEIKNLELPDEYSKWGYMQGDLQLNPVRLSSTSSTKWEVPVMLHYEGGALDVTAMTESGRLIWHGVVRYDLDPKIFERADLASGWTRISQNKVVLRKTIEEIAKETIIRDETHNFVFNNSKGLAMRMSITRTVQPSGEPLTYYMDRIWSLSSVAILFSPEVEELIRSGR